MNKGINFLENPDSLCGPELNESEPLISYEPPKLSSRKARKYGLFSVLAVLGVFIIFISLACGRFITSALNAKESLQSAQEYALVFDFENAQHQAQIAQKDLKTAQRTLWVAKPLVILPFVGDQVKPLITIIDTGVALVDILDDTLSIVSEVYDSLNDIQETINEVPGLDKSYTFNTLPAQVRVDMLQTLQAMAPDLAQAQLQVQITQDKLGEIDEENLVGPIKTVVVELKSVLPSVSSALELITPFAQAVGELAGVGEDKQWLLLFLNNTEMRPGGGFMGVYGLMQVRDGEILDITTDNTYAIDELCESPAYQVVPPYPISAYLGLDTWFFRDANWSPDFTESSKTAVQLLRQEYAFAGLPVPQIDGVIGFTPTVIEELLNIIGDITVDGITFTSENFTETLEYQVEYGFKDAGVAWEDRKEIINDLMDVLMDRLMNTEIEKLPNLLGVLTSMFEYKHIALYSYDENTQEVFEDANWSANMQSDGYDDVIMVLDANMRALKTDHAIEKEITYLINKVDDHFEAQVDILYKHTGTFDWRTTRYQTYTSIMAPYGSELLYTNGQNASANEESGFARFGSYFVVEPGGSGILTFKYRLPESFAKSIADKTYKLIVYKQIGAKESSLTLDLDFGKKLRAAQPSEDSSQFGDNIYYLNTNLVQDLELLVQF